MSTVRVPTVQVATTHVVLRRPPSARVRPADRSADRALLRAALALPPVDAYPAAVRAVAARLDVVRPGWHDRVDLGVLSMTSPYACVGGQVFGRYGAALVALGEDLPVAVVLDALSAACPPELWRAEVVGRRAALVEDAS